MTDAVTSELGVAPRRSRPGRGKRYWFVGLGLVLIVGVLAAVKFAQISSLMAFGKRAQAAGPPPETVGTSIAQRQDFADTLQSVGSVIAGRGVTVSNDAPGVVARIKFESGAVVKSGQVLLELDSSVERAQLAAARARRELAATTAGRTRVLAASGSVAPAQKDADDSQLSAATADERAITAQIDRKTVRAPFAGKLGIRLVNVGQFLPPGTPITLLESNDATYVDFSLPQEQIALVAVGMPVRMTIGNGRTGNDASAVQGKIDALEPAVDPTTRNIKLRATVPANEGTLRPGMFVTVTVVQPKKTTVVAVPTTAIVHASFGDSVFIVEDAAAAPAVPASEKRGKVARQQFVKPGQTRGDFVAINDGVKEGEEIVTAGAFKLRNGAPVVVNNAVANRPELSPHPANH